MSKNLSSFLAKPIKEEISSKSLDKWQIALLIASPIIIGSVAYYIYQKKFTKKTVNCVTNVNVTLNKNTPPKEVKKDQDKLEDPLSNAMSFKTKGNKFFKDRQYESAIECYSKAIECCPSINSENLSIFYQNRAASYEMIKKYEQVIEDCTKSIQLNKRYIKALLRRAKAYESLNKLQEAFVDITAVDILEKFQNQSNLLMTDRLLVQISKIKAKSYIKSRNLPLPTKHFLKEYFTLFTRDPIVKNPNIDEVTLLSLRKELEHAKEDGKLDSEAKYLLINGTIEVLKGNLANAEQDLSKVIKMEIEKNYIVNALIKLGIMKVKIDDNNIDGIETALKYFDKACRLDPKNPDIYIQRAQINLLANKIHEVLKDLNECIKLAPEFLNAYAQKVWVTFQMAFNAKDQVGIKNALEECNQMIQKFPNCSEVYALYARILIDKQEYEEANKCYAKAISCDPEDASLYVKQSLLLLNSKSNSEKGIKLLKKALNIDKKCQIAYEVLGSIEIQKANFKKGIEYLDEAIKWSYDEHDIYRLFTIRESAEAQLNAVKLLEIHHLPLDPLNIL